MTNYDKIAHVFGNAIGTVFTTAEIKAAVKQEFPEVNESSIMPGDMSHDDCRYADKLFVSTGRSHYRVLAVADRKAKATGRRASSDRGQALASVLQKLGKAAPVDVELAELEAITTPSNE